VSQTINLSIKGLHTYASELSGVPQGALSIADDVNISRVNIVEPRRGFNPLGVEPSDEVKKLVFYNSGLFAHYGTTFGYFNGSSWASKGTLITPSNATSVRSAAISNSLFITNANGISKLDAVSGTLYSAGIAKGTLIELNGSLSPTATATAVKASNSVAYRYILVRKDANNTTVFGGVSSRLVVTNTSTTNPSDVPLKVYLPSGLDTSFYAQIYRSSNTSGAPDDEMQLAYEAILTATDITNGYFTFTDIVPDELLGASLYTSPSQQGIVNDNSQPPLARDIAEYKNHLFFADVTGKYRYTVTLVACGGALGLAVNDTITITRGSTSEVYTAKASTVVASKQFAVDTSTTSLATRIDKTARTLVSVINQSSTLVYAYLLSTGDGDLPGKIMLEERTSGNSVFSVVSSNANAWNPNIKTAQNATNDEYQNGLMYSKQGIPESVPLKNIIRVGSSDDRIKRIVALRDGLFIFKEKDGVYVLRGENEASFSVSLLDGTAKIKAADSLAVVNNLIYGLFDSGICEVSDSGVVVIGLPIKDKVLELFGTAMPAIQSFAFGVGYDIDGKYILALPSVDVDTSCPQQFVFDVYGRTWCRWTLNMRSGLVDPQTGKLYYGVGGAAKIRTERKDYEYTDYADYSETCIISSYSGPVLTINNMNAMGVGDLLIQGDSSGYIESVDYVNGTVTIDATQSWVVGTPTVHHLKAILCRVEWNAEFAGNPAGYKQFYEASLLFKQGFQKEATMFFYSDTNPGESRVALTSSFGNGAWGEFAFGSEAWGGETVKAPTRLGVPRAVSRCNQLSVRFESRIAYSDFQLSGLSLIFNPTSTRTAR
jgi:hypothetical protein